MITLIKDVCTIYYILYLCTLLALFTFIINSIIEISLFEGRSVTSKKDLYQLIFNRFEQELGITPNDVEITLTETPFHNWGIRGKSGDELTLHYKVSV